MELSNAILAERARKDDPAAFAQLFVRYYALVFSVCFRRLRHREDAEDVTQETFSRVARYLHRWDPQRPLEPWLIAIASNRCRTFRSRRQTFRPLSVAREPTSDSIEERRSADLLAEELRLAMQTLPANHRRAFELFHEQSLGYAEIAAELGCPLGTVKTWVHRARGHLIQSLIDRGVIESSGKAGSGKT
jgi:RNA polymerase sigma-70 factor (ECF subfamily)